MKTGDKVEKSSGYKFPGVIVSVFETLAGQTRFVVECTIPGCEGMLHIYSEKNLKLSEKSRDGGASGVVAPVPDGE